MANQPAAENKMGVMPVNGLLLNMSIPIMISMLVQAFYNVVDSYFVSQIGQDALNAVSWAFPVQNLMIAVSVGTGVGFNALLSRSLGQGDREKVNRTAANGLFLIVLSSAVFMALGLTCSRLFYAVQTDIAGIVDYGTDYLTIVCGASLGLFTAVAMERMLQATGRTFYTMISQAVGALANIILDPILIFGLGPFPRMEVAGAALATVIGQFLGCGVGLFFNLTRNPDIQLSLKGFRPHGQTVREIYSVGLPSIIMQSIGSVMVFGINQILLNAFNDTATAVFGVYFKLQSFFFMPVFGLNNGMVPIVSYNYGARKPERIVRTIKLSVCYATALMVLGCIVFQVFPARLLALFQSEHEAGGDLISIGVPALRIISVSWLLAGFSIVSSSVFQALNHGMFSLSISVVRQLMVLLPAAFILSRFFPLEIVWLAFPIAELFSGTMCAIFLRRVYRQDVLPLTQPRPAEY